MTKSSCDDISACRDRFIDHPIQSLVSRTGSFPLRTAYQLLRQYAEPSSKIFDPFCGKGTTLFAARMLGLEAYGMDIAPEAVLCAKAKMVNVNLSNIIDYVAQLEVKKVLHPRVPDSVQVFFHPSTLSEILSVKLQLLKDIASNDKKLREKATLVLATLLGILHGHASYSLSIPSAHAYSMSPGYVKRFAAENGLSAPVQDVRSCLTKKLSRCLKIDFPDPVPSKLKVASVFNSTSEFPELVGKIDLIITSPPYLNAQTYAKDNWLRQWLLGYDYKKLRNGYLETGSVSRYRDRMEKVFEQFHCMLRSGGRLICIAGDVRVASDKRKNNNVLFQTGRFLANLCTSNGGGFRLQKFDKHTIASSSRYFHALSGSNGHSKRNLIERVFVAQKVGS